MFKLIKIDNSRINVPEPEYFEIAPRNNVNAGQALFLDNGLLAHVTSSSPVEFISMADGTEGKTIPVCRVSSNQIWETRIDGNERIWENAKPGSTVSVNADGVEISNVNADFSHCVIVCRGEADTHQNGYEVGGPVRVRFLCNFGRDASSTKAEV